MPRALRGEGVGHTPADFLALRSAEMDREDLMAEAAQRRQYQKWLLRKSSLTSADTSAPTQLQLEEGAQMQARAAKYRARSREQAEILQKARELAAEDRENRVPARHVRSGKLPLYR
jgi:hypothetical protein